MPIFELMLDYAGRRVLVDAWCNQTNATTTCPCCGKVVPKMEIEPDGSVSQQSGKMGSFYPVKKGSRLYREVVRRAQVALSIGCPECRREEIYKILTETGEVDLILSGQT